METRKQELFNYAYDIGVRIISAKSNLDGNRIAIHLLNPDLDALEDALNVAERDLFPAIVIHNNQTWPKGYSRS